MIIIVIIIIITVVVVVVTRFRKGIKNARGICNVVGYERDASSLKKPRQEMMYRPAASGAEGPTAAANQIKNRAPTVGRSAGEILLFFFSISLAQN